jgi:hypothetical protein
MELKGKFAVVTGSGGSMPQKSVNPPWLDRTLFPFRSRFIEIDGNTVHYIDEGRGPVLLLLHGKPCTRSVLVSTSRMAVCCASFRNSRDAACRSAAAVDSRT